MYKASLTNILVIICYYRFFTYDLLDLIFLESITITFIYSCQYYIEFFLPVQKGPETFGESDIKKYFVSLFALTLRAKNVPTC